MSNSFPMPPRMDVIVHRHLDRISSGNGAYLEMFLKVAREAGLDIRIVFAPWRSFGNRPWASIHPRFLALASDVAWPRSFKIGNLYWSASPKVWGRFVVRLCKAVMRKANFNPLVYSYLADPLPATEAALVADLCNDSDSSIALAEYSSMAPVLSLLRSNMRKGVLMHDLFSDRSTRFRENGVKIDFLEIDRQQEADWVADADFCIYASANEMAAFGATTPNAEHLWLRPQPPHHSIEQASGTPRVVFLGTQHAGNEDALKHFIDDIWPLVQRASPKTEFWVAGSVGRGISSARATKAGVKILGRVERLADIGGADAIGVAPTRLATGCSIKVAEYLMLGMPCVVYERAVEGFGDTLNDLIETAGNSEQFASQIIGMLEDEGKRRRMSELGMSETPTRLSNDDVTSYLRSLAQTSPDSTEDAAMPLSAEQLA